MDINIGGKLKQLRKEKKLSILELSRRSEVSTGLISQIERGLVVPSVVSMWKLSEALQVNIGYFFEEEKKTEEDVVIRRGEHRINILNKGNSFYELFVPEHDHKIDFMKITIKGGQSRESQHREKGLVTHEGEECGYVLSGTLTVALGDKEYTLYEGDSIYYPSTIPHKYLNYEDEDCVSIWAMTPVFF